MEYEIRLGRFRYISFIIVDLLCLLAANVLAAGFYLDRDPSRYGVEDYLSVVIIMVIIDVVVTIAFHTLTRVLRRRKRKELTESLRHVVLSFVLLALVLFTLRQGAAYSRVTVYLAYSIDFVLIVAARILWKQLLKRFRSRKEKPSALLMSTDRFAAEGVEELRRAGINVEAIYLLKNISTEHMDGIPIVHDVKDAASTICWQWIDKVYIYGVDRQRIPEALSNACREMGIKINFVDFNYKVIDVKTIKNEDAKYGALSFLEGLRDIPFPIRRVYWITETEADLHRGFHAHKLNCQMLFCPYGAIDIILDDGKEKNTVRLDEPGKGLILMPGLWREMVWQKSGSVLCVLASEYYDEKEYIRNYDDFIAYSKQYNIGA